MHLARKILNNCSHIHPKPRDLLVRRGFPPIIFFDLEGTVFRKCYRLDNGKVAPSAWTLLAEVLGSDCFAEEEETKDRWLRGEYAGYVEWMRDTIRIHKKYGLTRNTFEKVISAVEFTPGVQNVFAQLRSEGVVTVVVSGGMKALGDRAQRSLKIDHVMCGCEYFFDDDGLIDHFNLLPSDEKGKARFMSLIAEEHGVDPQTCAFVGDGKNDIPLARSVGYSIAFNAQAELKAACTASIEQAPGEEDFRTIISVLSQRER